MEKLKWHIEKRKLADLKEWEENPRTITKEGLSKLRERIRLRGFHDVLKIDIDNTILSGNRRRGVLIEEGYVEVDCKVPNRKLTEEERAKVALESNMQDGEWEIESLLNFDEEWLEEVGFEAQEIEKMALGDFENEDLGFDFPFGTINSWIRIGDFTTEINEQKYQVIKKIIEDEGGVDNLINKIIKNYGGVD